MSVALVGVDGAGKSTAAHAVVAGLPIPARYLYMGVNLDASSDVLPTTRLALRLKRRAGRRPDMTVRFEPDGGGSDGSAAPGLARRTRRLVRLAAWVAEEWYRQLVAWRYRRRGFLVVMDRHFFCDYYAADVRPRAGRPLESRLHGWLLDRFYPRPDLVVCLDAPADVLWARRPEGDRDALERRRSEYLELRGVVPDFEVVDALRPADVVAADIIQLIDRRRPLGAADATRGRSMAAGPENQPYEDAIR